MSAAQALAAAGDSGSLYCRILAVPLLLVVAEVAGAAIVAGCLSVAASRAGRVKRVRSRAADPRLPGDGAKTDNARLGPGLSRNAAHSRVTPPT